MSRTVCAAHPTNEGPEWVCILNPDHNGGHRFALYFELIGA